MSDVAEEGEVVELEPEVEGEVVGGAEGVVGIDRSFGVSNRLTLLISIALDEDDCESTGSDNVLLRLSSLALLGLLLLSVGLLISLLLVMFPLQLPLVLLMLLILLLLIMFKGSTCGSVDATHPCCCSCTFDGGC